MVVITKIDICPPHILQQTITQLTKILKSPGARKIPIFIKNREECINTAVRTLSSHIFLLSSPANEYFRLSSSPHVSAQSSKSQT